jgi:poly(hydroxyalkanoate) depolymerase family esterase
MALVRPVKGVLRAVAAASAALLLGVLPAQSGAVAAPSGARAAQLERVDGFGSNPGGLTQYRYVPDGLPQGAPVVLLLHGCSQDGPGYFTGAGWQAAADAGGFAVIAAQQESGNNLSRCFNWFQPGDQRRGSGEALSLKQMVDHTLAATGGDPGRVFVTGLSAGGAMTATMLAAYPDVFRGGAVVAGLPHGCADSMVEAFGCMTPGVQKTPQQWGDLVRAAHDHSGARPAVSVWHGGADWTVATANATESVKQWTNVLGADQTADATSALPGGTVRSEYHDGAGTPVVRSYIVPGMGHGTPVKPSEGCGTAGAFFLDTVCSTRHITGDWGI